MRFRLLTVGRRGLATRCLLVLALCLPGLWASAADPLLPPFDAEVSERKHDWVQLASGEWLKGEITRMYDGKLYFESDEFDSVTLDWSDVSSLIPSRIVTLRLSGRRVLSGDFEMHNGVGTLQSGDETLEIKRGDVKGMTVGDQDELGYWSGSVSLGFSTRGGNSTQSDLNLRGEVKRQTTLTRSRVSYTGAISSSEGVDTANSHRAPASFDVFMTDRFFLTPFSFEYFSDEFQNIARRLTIGAGLGYDLYSNSVVSWEVGGGLAYQSTTYDSVVAGDSKTAGDIAVIFTTTVDLDLPRGIDWDNQYEIQVVATDLGKTNHRFQSVLSIDIWGPLDIEAAFYFDRVEEPVPTGSSIPKSNDYRMTFGLGLDL